MECPERYSRNSYGPRKLVLNATCRRFGWPIRLGVDPHRENERVRAGTHFTARLRRSPLDDPFFVPILTFFPKRTPRRIFMVFL